MPESTNLESKDFQQVEVLLSSLAEYTQKLKLACDRWVSQRVRFQMNLFIMVVPMMVAGSLFYFFVRGERDLLFPLFAIAGLALMTIAYFLFSRSLGEIRLSYNKNEIDVMARQVGRLIRLASQYEEHVAPDFTSRMMLDLRLAEAEAVLQYSERIVGSDISAGTRYSKR